MKSFAGEKFLPKAKACQKLFFQSNDKTCQNHAHTCSSFAYKSTLNTISVNVRWFVKYLLPKSDQA